MAADGIVWDIHMDDFLGDLAEYNTKFTAAVKTICDTVARKMENWAKDNAIWINRTGNARQGLTGQAIWKDHNTIWVCVCHSVDYGVWLELAMGRKYAILEKAVESNKDELINALFDIV